MADIDAALPAMTDRRVTDRIHMRPIGAQIEIQIDVMTHSHRKQAVDLSHGVGVGIGTAAQQVGPLF